MTRISLFVAFVFAFALIADAQDGESGLSAAKETDVEMVEPNENVKEAQEAVKNAGWMTIEHGYDVNNPYEKGVRGPSIVKPLPATAVPEPVIFSNEVMGDGSGRITIACPRDVVDQMHVATKILVHNEKGEQIECEAKLVYTHTPKDDPRYLTEEQYNNPVFVINLNNEKAVGKLKVRGVHWFLRGKYPPVNNIQLANAMDAKSFGALQRAADAGKGLPAGAAQKEHIWDISKIKAGMCLERALLAKQAGNSGEEYRAEVIDGYADAGGPHTNNLISSSAGSLMLDPQPAGPYAGPNKNFIITAVGAIHQIDEIFGHRCSTLAAVTSEGVEAQNTVVSVPSGGPDAAQLVDMQLKMQSMVKKLAAARGRPLNVSKMSAEEKVYLSILNLSKELYEWRQGTVYLQKVIMREKLKN